MAGSTFSLRYDGGMAADHRIDMRDLGTSLIGVERIISDALIVTLEGRLPRRRERRDFIIVVETPKAHCFDISGALDTIPGLLPFIQDILKDYTKDFVTTLFSYVLCLLGGRPREASVAFDKLMELTQKMHEGHLSERAADREYALATQENMIRLAETLKPAARQAVAPIGRSCNELRLPQSPGVPATVIDVAMADAIRAKEPVEVGDMTRMIVHIDTVSISRRAMRVQIPGDTSDAFVEATIRDPAFDENPNHNIYTASLGGLLAVDVKPTYRKETGELIKLHVMNAEAA